MRVQYNELRIAGTGAAEPISAVSLPAWDAVITVTAAALLTGANGQLMARLAPGVPYQIPGTGHKEWGDEPQIDLSQYEINLAINETAYVAYSARASSVLGPPLNGLALWLKADSITGLADNDPVALWADSSPSGNDYSQGTAANRPLFKPNILNGMPVVRFDAVNDALLATAPIASAAPLCIFAALRYGVSGVAARALDGDGGPGNNWAFSKSTLNVMRVFNGAQIPDGNTDGIAFHIHTFLQLAGPANEFFVDGVSIGTNAATNYPGTIQLGAAGDFTEPLNGDIAEVLVYVADKSPQRTRIEDYLRAKYGLG